MAVGDDMVLFSRHLVLQESILEVFQTTAIRQFYSKATSRKRVTKAGFK
jgi:hypothetical protein